MISEAQKLFGEAEEGNESAQVGEQVQRGADQTKREDSLSLRIARETVWNTGEIRSKHCACLCLEIKAPESVGSRLGDNDKGLIVRERHTVGVIEAI